MSRLIPCACALAALAAAACGNFNFESNLKPQNFRDYFRPSAVQVIDESYLESHHYRELGQITGLSCQEKERDYIANEADARTAARLKAAEAGANAIRFGHCVRAEDTGVCKVSVTCHARIYAVSDDK